MSRQNRLFCCCIVFLCYSQLILIFIFKTYCEYSLMVRILKTVSQIDVSGAMIFHKCSCSKSICHNSLLNYCISGVYMTACVFHFPMRLPMNPDRDSCKTQVLQHPYPGSVEHFHKSAFREHWASDLQSICDNSSTDSDIRQCLILDLQSICVNSSIDSDIWNGFVYPSF